MKEKFYIGLDGGGTKTKCVVTDYNLQQVFESSGGPSNFLIIGTEKVSETVLGLIIEAKEKLNIANNQIAAILIGTTGAGRVNDANKLKNDFLKYAESQGEVYNYFFVDSDARIALEGAFSGKPGSLLIAGTGSIIIGKDKLNNFYRAGGFGKFIGDEGSGNAIGRRGLMAVARNYDNRGTSTLLTQILKRDFGISDTSELITEVYRNDFPLSSFAPKVMEAAESDDSEAKRILDEESDELILHVRSMYECIGEEKLKLTLMGGTLSDGNYYSNLFVEKVNKNLPNVIITKAENPPAVGAAYMAKSLAVPEN